MSKRRQIKAPPAPDPDNAHWEHILMHTTYVSGCLYCQAEIISEANRAITRLADEFWKIFDEAGYKDDRKTNSRR